MGKIFLIVNQFAQCPAKCILQHNLPNSLLINGLVLKGSKSSICSPVPIKIIGLLVAATLEIKPHIKR